MRRATLVVVALCGAWYGASSASNVVGKLVLTEFPFPMTVTLVQLVAVALLTGPALALAGVPAAPPLPPDFYWRALLPLAAAKIATTLCSQVSIWRVPVSYAHTVKATTPLWTALLTRVVLGERQPRGVGRALLLIAGGVALASATELRLDALGLGAALAAAALLSAQHVATKRLMRARRLHALRLLQALAGPALLLALPPWLLLDAARLPAPGARTAALLAAGGALAWLQAALAVSVLARVSPLTYAVASAAKRAVVVAASLLLLRNPTPPANVAGMALAALGVLAYNRAKLARAPPPPPLLPV